jgi:hypothetical protein
MNDFAQLAQWRAYRIAQQQIVAWSVRVAYQTRKNSLAQQDVLVRAQTEADTRCIALQRYLKMYPRRQQAWVEGVKRVEVEQF